MKLPPQLYVIEEPEAPAASNVFGLSGIRSHPDVLATQPALAAPWPRQVDWDRFSRKLGL